MTTLERLVLGGLGAVTPVVVALVATDPAVLLEDITRLVVLGHFLRATGLFFLGALIAFLYKDENKRFKVFQLGLAAPALLTTMLTARQIEPYEGVPPPQPSAAYSMLIPSAYAQPPEQQSLKTFSLPEESAAQQLFRGLKGSRVQRAWFVIAGSYEKLAIAQKRARFINEKTGLAAEIYGPYRDNPCYSVVIGANLSNGEAINVREKAIAKGLTGVRLWAFP